MSEPKNVVFAESYEVDFDQLLWTFEITSNDRVAAGTYAIIPMDEYAELVASLKLAKEQGGAA